MANPLGTYLQDHLAGAQFAVSLLEDLRDHGEAPVAQFARELLAEIEEDRRVLQPLVDAVSEGGSVVKETTAWMAQKASRVKLSPSNPLGMFESLEMLCVGILGKRALWTALRTACATNEQVARLDLDELEVRAVRQHDRTEQMRLAAARATFVDTHKSPSAGCSA